MSLETTYQHLRQHLLTTIFGLDEAVDLTLAALFSGGHILVQGPPGTAKTLLMRTLAGGCGLDFRRIQMTPDLLPGDITGSLIFRQDQGKFDFARGPIFANLLLADELNRASARTQSALLEAMQENTVTVGGTSHRLPDPFLVVATQNPVEQEGTYPLPIAQLDRFMFQVQVDYPGGEAEEQIYRVHHGTGAALGSKTVGNEDNQSRLSAQDIIDSRELIRRTHIRDEVLSYVRRLVENTRHHDALSLGASPRAGLMLLMGAKSLARFAGRDYVTPEDIQEAFRPALRHRIVLSPTAEMDGATSDAYLDEILESVEVPR